jgi:hypothetical protein
MWMGTPFAPPQQQGYAGYPAPPYVAPPPPPEGSEEPVEAAPVATNGSREDDVAAMRRELDELKQAIREGLGARGPKKRKKA